MADRNSPTLEMATRGVSAAESTLRQIASVVDRVIGPDVAVSPDGQSFATQSEKSPEAEGIITARGRILEGAVAVRFELVRTPEEARGSLTTYFEHLAGLGDHTRIVPPVHRDAGWVSLWVELQAKPHPMSASREATFTKELKEIDSAARALQAEAPSFVSDESLAEIYRECAEYLGPLAPWPPADAPKPPEPVTAWAERCCEFIEGATSLAISSEFPVVSDFALAVLAGACSSSGRSLGQITIPRIDGGGLLEMNRKAPERSIVVVPAVRMSLGSSLYDASNEAQALLATLASVGRSVIFTGSYEELQALLGEGQGNEGDPLQPIVRRAHDIDIESLARFFIHRVGRHCGGLTSAAEVELTSEVVMALQGIASADQRRLLPSVARRAVTRRDAGKATAASIDGSFVSELAGLSETLTGLGSVSRGHRSSDVEERFVQALTDPSFAGFLREHLVGQDEAIEQLAAQLMTECLARPSHQPLRICLQGPPATGKSQSAELIARRLGVPYMVFDASAIADHYTATAQLLGSSRGIVGSYQSGRLERVARHHAGAVFEIADLDHAPDSVRTTLADTFLGILDSGHAQSATGATFSCANVVLVFSLNLPGNADLHVRRSVGFRGPPSRHEVTERVLSELRGFVSSAFLSRLGAPVLFEPLDETSWAEILERAVRTAVTTSLGRLKFDVGEVQLDAAVGARVMASLDKDIETLGSRALLEHGRALAAAAVAELQRRNELLAGRAVHVTAAEDGRLMIEAVE